MMGPAPAPLPEQYPHAASKVRQQLSGGLARRAEPALLDGAGASPGRPVASGLPSSAIARCAAFAAGIGRRRSGRLRIRWCCPHSVRDVSLEAFSVANASPAAAGVERRRAPRDACGSACELGGVADRRACASAAPAARALPQRHPRAGHQGVSTTASVRCCRATRTENSPSGVKRGREQGPTVARLVCHAPNVLVMLLGLRRCGNVAFQLSRPAYVRASVRCRTRRTLTLSSSAILRFERPSAASSATRRSAGRGQPLVLPCSLSSTDRTLSSSVCVGLSTRSSIFKTV